MRVLAGGVRLFVDVLGPGLQPSGWEWRTRPTLLLIHGGPGVDHLAFRQPGSPYERLNEFAQVVMVDLRGCGASDVGTPEEWTLANWAQDVAAVIDTLGLDRPTVLGESAGGFVALELAKSSPDAVGGLVLANSSAHMSIERITAAFARRGGDDASAVARAFWTDPADPVAAAEYFATCMPLYSPVEPAGGKPPILDGPVDTERHPRVRYNHELLAHFATNEMFDFDHRDTLATFTQPLLIIAGAQDPICPVEDSEDMVAAAASDHLTYRRVEHAGHTVAASDPDLIVEAIRRQLIDTWP